MPISAIQIYIFAVLAIVSLVSSKSVSTDRDVDIEVFILVRIVKAMINDSNFKCS